MKSRRFGFLLLFLSCCSSFNNLFAQDNNGLTAETILHRYIDALGGTKALADIYDISMYGTGEAGGLKVNIRINIIRPDTSIQEVTDAATNTVLSLVTVAGDSVQQVINNRTVPINNSQKLAYRSRSQFCPELSYLSSDHSAKLELSPKQEMVNGRPMNVITIATIDGAIFKNYYDAATNLKMRSVALSSQEEEMPDVISDYDDYKKVYNILLPFTFKNSTNGVVTAEVAIKKVEINSGYYNK
jgi:hypothetical protein